MKKGLLSVLLMVLLLSAFFGSLVSVSAEESEKEASSVENVSLDYGDLDLRIETSFGRAKAFVKNTGDSVIEGEKQILMCWSYNGSYSYYCDETYFDSLSPGEEVGASRFMFGFGRVEIFANVYRTMEDGGGEKIMGPIYVEGFLILGFFVEI